MPEKKLAELCKTCEETGSEYIQMLRELRKNYRDKKIPSCFDTAGTSLSQRARGNHDAVWEWIYLNVGGKKPSENTVYDPQLLMQFLTDCSHCQVYKTIGRSSSQKIYQHCPNM